MQNAMVNAMVTGDRRLVLVVCPAVVPRVCFVCEAIERWTRGSHIAWDQTSIQRIDLRSLELLAAIQAQEEVIGRIDSMVWIDL